MRDARAYLEKRIPAFTGIAVAFMPYSDEARDIQDWAYEHAHITVMVLAHCTETLTWLSAKRAEFDFIIVDVEHVGGVHAAIELCLGIRAARPESRIILLSGETERDDAGSERRAICDATLRKPVTHRRFTDVLTER